MSVRWQMLGTAQEYRLFNEKQLMGILKNNFWNRKAYSEFKGFLVRFEHSGIGKKKARILDIEGTQELGTIDFSFFPESAIIQYEAQQHTWRLVKTGRQKKWIVQSEEEQADYLANDRVGSTGQISDSYLPPVVVVAGLYIHGFFFKQRLLRIIGLCLVILLTAFLLY
ncbi:hypothetical protein [Arundinibacter roseus]|uniref:Uncharacterized protein n=1 Tax=Arundinibacter roseus TaxID=2070510 RepID=A0A4R4KQ50_9BACT|nr:hypothetical protein [Arundinibacter roseus]TDB69032.1 hypothetical protein EZE20_01480 [Arundinibacter roseus]